MKFAETHSAVAPSRPSSIAIPDSKAILTAFAVVVLLLAVRFAMGLQLDGMDDAGYLEAARRVSRGESLDSLFPLFRTRVGMAYPLGWLVGTDWMSPSQFWLLTTMAECVTVVSLLVAGRLLGGATAVGVWAALLYAVYPLAVQQGMMYYPTAFQVASITAALALIGAAEGLRGSNRIALAFAGGVSLGLGYLVKEDVAIVVPALVLAAAVVRYPRISTTFTLCAGAALVFALESLVYWQSTGNPLFRLNATSGLGFASQDNLKIGAIYHWGAYLRSLWLMPFQVGIMWWLLIPASWTMWRARARGNASNGTAFVVLLLVIVGAYLEFGSGSFRTYSPLPKTPRYTALVTPMVMLLVGAWLTHLFNTRRIMARWVVGAVTLSAIPCIMFLAASSGERTRNTRSVLPALEQIGEATLYSDFYSVRLLRLLKPNSNVAVWFHARFDTNEIVIHEQPAEHSGAYVLLDRQMQKFYTSPSSYGISLPATIAEPPADWKIVWTERAYGDGSVTRTLLESMRTVLGKLPEGSALRVRGVRYIADMIDNDRATLYQVP